MPAVTLHYCNSDAEWSKVVRERYLGICGWPGCWHPGIGGAHVIPRGVLSLRRCVENGVYLCKLHHDRFDLAKPKVKETMAKLLVSPEVFEALRLVEKAPPPRAHRPSPRKEYNL
jgi:hypothetical protein